MAAYESFGELRLASTEAFVRTAILIDNEPSPGIAVASADEQPMIAQSAAFSTAAVVDPDESAELKEPPQPVGSDPLEDEGRHRLLVLPVTNAFAARKITCGFYFPANDDEQVVATALHAARHVDVTIVDWQLKPGDIEPAKALISELISDDRAIGGRLRLIVVYTGERGLDAECTKLQEHLTAAGLDDFETKDDGRALRARDTLITFANKPQPSRPELELAGPGARPIGWEELPKFVLEQYAHLAEGLLQSFALKSIGAVRDDTPHLLSVFAPELDGAYLAQRAGIGTPTDAEEMMTALLTGEFATSITDRGIPGEILGADAAIHALQVRAQPETIKVKDYKPEPIYKAVVQMPQGGGKHILADKATLESLCRTGLNEQIVTLSDEHRKLLDRQFFENDNEAEKALSRFARLASFSREANDARRIGSEELALTGGVIVRSAETRNEQVIETFRLCVQPGCDAVRLQGEVPFPFCRMKENENSFDLVLAANGADRYFKVERKPRSLVMLHFQADATKQVVVSEKHDGRHGFWSADKEIFWEFVAELRPLEAQYFTSLLVGKFNRVALNGSEWLRLHGGGDGD